MESEDNKMVECQFRYNNYFGYTSPKLLPSRWITATNDDINISNFGLDLNLNCKNLIVKFLIY